MKDANSLLKRALKGSTVFLVGAGVLLLLHSVDPNIEFFSTFVDEHIRSAGLGGILLYVGLTGLLICTGLPRQVLSFAGGYAFGAWWGFVWATAGVTLGGILSFSYARYIGQGIVHRRFGPRIARLEGFLGQAPFLMTFIVRCLPVGNNLLTNILAGVSTIPALPFILGSWCGYMPQNFIFALLGSGINVDPFWRILISAMLFLIASVLGIFLYQRYRHHL